MNILYIANALPYDTIRHAGGKTFNYYLKSLAMDQNKKIMVVGICNTDELSRLGDSKGLEIVPIVSRGDFCTNTKRVFWDIYGKLFNCKKCDNSYYKYKLIFDSIRRLKFTPDVIVLEWTNMVLLCKDIKMIFPNSKIIASEHDVNFLGLFRKYEVNKNIYNFRRYEHEKEKELESLKHCDKIFVQNEKDKILLMNNGILGDTIEIISPYFHDMSYIKRKNIKRDILFWGAMYRKENYEAAIWFIEQVMPLLVDYNVRFVVAGNKPPKELLVHASDDVIITGFVEDESELFIHSTCFVAPLLTGAGIKVKIIEALSSGIPVLTNSIGIEGIPATDGVSYYHCENPNDYAKIIIGLLSNQENDEFLIERKRFILEHYNLSSSAAKYKNVLETTIGKIEA